MSEMQCKCFLGIQFICMTKRDLIAIHLITLYNILEYMQIAITQTDAADLLIFNINTINICVILNFWPQL